MIVGQIGEGVSVDELLADYPYIEREDIMQALGYAGIKAITLLAADIDQGALVTIDQHKTRVTLLPL
jgi:tryptophan synthase alpha subunit